MPASNGLAADTAPAASPAPGVLLVCNGSTIRCPALPPGAAPYFRTVQSAVDAASPGDWILIYPGVYHEKSTQWPTAGVWIEKPDLHVRGLDRNGVIIDGSNGTAARPCPSAAAQQDLTPRDGIVVSKASGVTIQNLTVCDYLAAGNENYGNEIWWNGGDGTGTIGLGAYSGSYLTATSEYAPATLNSPQLAQYGIFVSNSSGPGLITNSYASNMADAAYYVGACRQACDTTLANDTGVDSALGYSGTNSGGRLVIRNSVFRLNHAGIVPNSENNDDAPSPQDGRCPGSAAKSCTVIEDNLIRDNNNPNTPANGTLAPIGTGIQVAGGEYDTVTGNIIDHQGSWGVLTTDFPDSEKPPSDAHCQGGVPNDPLPGTCLYEARGNVISGNVFSNVGFFGNLTNSDLATETLSSYTPRNCFYGNTDRGGTLTSAPANIERSSVDGQPCTGAGTGLDLLLAAQLACATAGEPCLLPSFLASYPKQTSTMMLPLPRLATMPNPCAGVPKNALCP
ncbi:MAG TPA: hypothetical protein VHT26_14020 [Trebonia sp.]|nr:hypothetical protein [Trebonia sp.]